MINLIKSEFYRLFNRKYIYVFWSILVFISLVFNILNALFMKISLDNMLSMSLLALIIPVFLWPVLTEAIIGEEFKENTYMNIASFGISKTTYFLSKVIVSAGLVFITVCITVLTYAGSAFLLSTAGEKTNTTLFTNYLPAVMSALPLYIAAIIISTLLTFWIKKNGFAIFSYLGLFFFINPLLSVLHLFGIKQIDAIRSFLITSQIFDLMGRLHTVNIKTSHMQADLIGGGTASGAQMLTAAGVGLVYILILVVAGALVNREWK